MASSTSLSRQIRSILGLRSDALTLSELLIHVDELVSECSFPGHSEALSQLEEELQLIHSDVVDHSSMFDTEVFLAVLYHLCPILPSTSVISTWFDLVLRRSLRETKLPPSAINHAKTIIVSTLQKVDDHPDRVAEFRRRLLEFYLLDAFNEGSESDVLEWAGLDEQQRDIRARWKYNLEQILLKLGAERPQDLMTEIHDHFSIPSSRLQLLMLLNQYTSEPSFKASAVVFATHPLTSRILYSLLLDNSSTVCTIGLTLLAKLLTLFAVQAPERLKSMLPELLTILARIMCWKERLPLPGGIDITATEVEIDSEIQAESTLTLQIRSGLAWERLESTFNATVSPPPPLRPFFTILYYLFPCNVLRFLREPILHLRNSGFASPYTVDWEEALDEDEIRSQSEALLRGHICHPLIIWRDADAELSGPDFWVKYNEARIISEATMLDIRNAKLGLQERHSINPDSAPRNSITLHMLDRDDSMAQPANIPSDKAKISLENMIATSVALKSNVNIEILKPSSQWPISLFQTSSSTPKRESTLLNDNVLLPEDHGMPSHVAQAISALQREVVLLRNELNFELWLSRENVQHIGRLYDDRILSKNAETERQGLYNKLRKYRAQVTELERELRDHKEQASSAKNKYADWNTELQNKLRDFREEKKSWISEAAVLRTAEKEVQARFTAQGELLADATKELFNLQIQKKETQHKVDRLRDYEQQIEQHVKMQRLWDEDFRRFNERKDHMDLMQSQYRKIEIRLETYEKTLTELEEVSRGYRRQIQTLEAQLSLATRNMAKRKSEANAAAFATEKMVSMNARLREENARQREENMDLRDEVEELKAMVEVLKGQVSGRKGLIFEPRSSPTLYG